MQAKFLAMLACAASLCACGQPQGETPASDAKTPPGATQSLPPLGDPPRYVGFWAVSREMCADPPWRFEANGVSTQGEVSCTFDTVSETPSGYAIDATCYVEGPPAPHRIQLSFAESAQGMLVSGGPWSDEIGLIPCGPPDGD